MPKPLSKNSRTSSQRPVKSSQTKIQITASRISQTQTLSHIDNIMVKCSGHNLAKQFCVSSECQVKLRWTCFNQECTCQAEHQFCKKSSLNSAVKKIKRKIVDSSGSLKEEINKVFDSLIQKITSTKDTLILKVDQQKDKHKDIDLSQLERKFIRIVEKSQDNEFFSATQTKQLWINLNQQNKQNFNFFHQLTQQLKSFEAKQTENYHGLIQVFDISLKGTQKNIALPVNSVQQIQQEVASPRGLLFSQSKLIRNFIETKRLTKLFAQDKKIKGAAMIFRASKYNFSLKQYFDLCGNVQNTLILCETNNGKLIGGFSPLSHQFTGKGRKDFLGNEPVADQSKSSFVFSLSNNDKFELIKSSFAIYRYKSKSFIQFGEGQLKICDFANKNTFSSTQINNGSYQCANYKNGSKDSYIRFNGNQTAQFTAWQWQVWRIQFEQVLVTDKK